MARWITVKTVPFDYRWPDRSAITAFTTAGEYFVKDEVADFAIERGYASDGKTEGSTARSTKGKTPRRASAKSVTREPAVATTANDGTSDRVDQPIVADDDRPADRPPVDSDAE